MRDINRLLLVLESELQSQGKLKFFPLIFDIRFAHNRRTFHLATWIFAHPSLTFRTALVKDTDRFFARERKLFIAFCRAFALGRSVDRSISRSCSRSIAPRASHVCGPRARSMIGSRASLPPPVASAVIGAHRQETTTEDGRQSRVVSRVAWYRVVASLLVHPSALFFLLSWNFAAFSPPHVVWPSRSRIRVTSAIDLRLGQARKRERDTPRRFVRAYSRSYEVSVGEVVRFFHGSCKALNFGLAPHSPRVSGRSLFPRPPRYQRAYFSACQGRGSGEREIE